MAKKQLSDTELQALFRMQRQLGLFHRTIHSMQKNLEDMQEEIFTIGIRLIEPEGGNYGEGRDNDVDPGGDEGRVDPVGEGDSGS